MRRALIVGAGAMGRAWAKNLLDCDAVEVAGWADLRPEAVESAARELGLEHIWLGSDAKQGVQAATPDFVVDVTTPESHMDVTLAALELGIPVLGEKPMASSMEEARAMVRASRESRVLYMVSQSRRYDARLKAYRHLIEQIGGLGILTADFFIGPHFGGFREVMDSVLLVDMAIHTFDQARYLSRADPRWVYCEEFNPSYSWFRGDACAFASFEMSNSLKFHYRGSWCAEGLSTSWESQWRAVGSLGSAAWDGHGLLVAEQVTARDDFFSQTRRLEGQVESTPHPGIAGSLRDFLRALDDPSHVPMARCDDNIKSLAMVFAAVQSAKEGRRVQVPPLWEAE